MSEKYIGLIEFNEDEENESGEWHNFEIFRKGDRLLFGSFCNTGFLESGYMELEGFDIDSGLEELLADLKTYFTDGPDYVSRIVYHHPLR